MTKKVLTFIIAIIAIIGLNGCAPKTVSMGSVDKTDKSIIITGKGYFPGIIRKAFKKNGWKVTTQTGYKNTQGVHKDTVNVNTKYVYNARYTFDYTYWEYTMLRIEPDYGFRITIFDNKFGEDIVNFSSTGGEDGAMEVDDIAKLIFEWINKNME
ncbi:MAG: hypothetical protein KAJ49_01610 [Arcobacteraceae bacterium]|nr:hypothetical protein [Arcobacteraceae bacterium]